MEVVSTSSSARPELRAGAPLAPFSTIRVGGPADWLAAPAPLPAPGAALPSARGPGARGAVRGVRAWGGGAGGGGGGRGLPPARGEPRGHRRAARGVPPPPPQHPAAGRADLRERVHEPTRRLGRAPARGRRLQGPRDRRRP